jgi:hypothetical protein
MSNSVCAWVLPRWRALRMNSYGHNWRRDTIFFIVSPCSNKYGIPPSLRGFEAELETKNPSQVVWVLRPPLDGALNIFVNRRGSQLKCLYFDRSGFCIWGKRLEAGRFISDWRAVRTREMDRTGLKLLPEGLEGKRIRKRFSLPSVITKSL